jgi:Na+-transporting methylmalonyl-CoA/oxaloacetate decarboxylase beta subunit
MMLLFADPKKFVSGAAAQFGVYFLLPVTLVSGLPLPEACPAGIIGGC